MAMKNNIFESLILKSEKIIPVCNLIFKIALGTDLYQEIIPDTNQNNLKSVKMSGHAEGQGKVVDFFPEFIYLGFVFVLFQLCFEILQRLTCISLDLNSQLNA